MDGESFVEVAASVHENVEARASSAGVGVGDLCGAEAGGDDGEVVELRLEHGETCGGFQTGRAGGVDHGKRLNVVERRG